MASSSGLEPLSSDKLAFAFAGVSAFLDSGIRPCHTDVAQVHAWVYAHRKRWRMRPETEDEG
jgi:hypothetical protein